MASVFGTAIKRREDPRLITGNGRYTDDVQLPGMLYAAILRSPHAHARIRRLDVEKAKRAPGVVAVFTGQDVAGKVAPIPTAWLPPGSDIKTTAHPALAVEKVRYVGDGVAMVVAESRYAARDALELIEVDYEVLPAVVDAEKAMEEGAPVLHDDAPGNVAFHWQAGEDPAAEFEGADVVVRHRFRQQRLIPNAMEPRSAVAQYNAGSGEMTMWLTSQNPHIHRFLLSNILGIPEHKLRVVAVDVGGGFGSKIACYADEALVGFAARELGRPVKWTEDRRENFLVTTHGRDEVIYAELAGKRDGTMVGLRIRMVANMGAYLSTAAPGVPTILFGLITVGPYRIPKAHVDVFGVFTNTTPTDAYRGAGRPEATYVIERMADLFAKEIGKDPVEIREKNFIPSDAFPYTTPLGLQYDSGNYEGTLRKAMDMLNYEEFRKEQERLRAQGRYVGIGWSTYVEICGLGPSQVAGAVGFQGGLWESATVRVHPGGKVTVFTGASPHGQGEETTFAQIVADRFGIPVEDVEVVHGDTDRISMGWGTYGSRTTPVGGSAIAMAADRVLEKARKIAAHMLEVSEEDVEFADGTFQVKGVPSRQAKFQDVVLQAHLAWNLPPGVEPGLEAQAFYDPVNFCYPFGAHACVVEVDPETGKIEILRYVAVDDCGPVINPMIVEGQVHGGIVQGVGQALWEGAVYDEQGQLVTGSFMDYAMPKAKFFPAFETAHTVTPAPHNPLGVKGIGETGTIAATPAVVNAVVDALAPFGVTDLEMPLTPEKIWKVIHGREA
ncbi:carbon monoxide dehydrogenase [Kyrpidia spormannii]|uniref:Carbon monoxide dehydrogenase n=2 Tax=Kyrpidia spormannii TaxID=2055160 RepID=A0A2K8N8V7_9BACL|nr:MULTISPECIES: molybdopterin cofactor-binding domain-containing protein [Kyrpidia]ATY85761.1 carbon monoxide dehydrogenase [Kyrpidia spormannii]MCL6575791.1 molybdopterin-dependent oxidoreductase [Kyrpidia sp.]CAB3394426.1 Carbon monoxide dehydrogenase large chain [Kyrpidia spormannii]CAB3395369.1 Carbon monoxide dehydrogenase large chain [Kyrpidia spormannii]